MASHPSDAGEARPAINVRHHEGFSAVPTHIGEIDRFGQVTRGVDKKKIEALSSPMEILSLSKNRISLWKSTSVALDLYTVVSILTDSLSALRTS
jgi:hypothetical protein